MPGAVPTEEACGIRSPKRYFTAQVKYTGDARRASCSSSSAGRRTTRPIRPTKSRRASGRPTSAGSIGRRPSAGARSSARTTSACRTATRTPATLSYVTGAHHVKGGMQLGRGGNRHQRDNQRRHRPLPGIPDGRRRAAAGVGRGPQHAAMGAQRTSSTTSASTSRTPATYKRLTLSPGIRFERSTPTCRRRVAGGTVRPIPRVRRDREPAELARRGAAPWRRLRRVRRRPDGDQGPRRQVHASVLHRRVRCGLQPDGHRHRPADVDRLERRRHRAGQRDRPGQHAVQRQRRQQPERRSRHQAALPVGVQSGHSAGGGHGRLLVVQLDTARLQAPVLDATTSSSRPRTTPSSPSSTRSTRPRRSRSTT